MNLSGCLRSLCSFFDRPGADLLLTCRKETHESQQAVAGSNQFVKARLLQAKILQKSLLLVIFQLRDLLLNLRADNEDFRTGLFRILADSGNIRILCSVIRRVILRDICRKDHRLRRQKVILGNPFLLFLVRGLKGDRRLSVLQMGLQTLQQIKL